VAAAPAGEDEQALLVGEVEERVVPELCLQADRVQVEVPDVLEVGREGPGRKRPQQHVLRPGRAAHEDPLTVDPEETVALLRDLGGTRRDAEPGVLLVGRHAPDREAQGEVVETGVPISAGHQSWGFSIVSSGKRPGSKRTERDARASSRTSWRIGRPATTASS